MSLGDKLLATIVLGIGFYPWLQMAYITIIKGAL